MVTKIAARACALALAATAVWGANANASHLLFSWPSLSGEKSGRVSFTSTIAGTRTRAVVVWANHASRFTFGAALETVSARRSEAPHARMAADDGLTENRM